MRFKIMITGYSEVGKTAIQKRFCTGQFTDDYVPTNAPTTEKKSKYVDGSWCDVNVCDMPNLTDADEDKRFFNAFHPFARKLHAIVLVYDIGNRNSFDRIQRHMRIMKECCKNLARLDDVEDWTKEPVFMLVGNKCDLADFERKVTWEDGESRADFLDIPFMEISARENIDVDFMFSRLANAVQNKKDEYERKKADEERKKKNDELLNMFLGGAGKALDVFTALGAGKLSSSK